MVDNFQPLSYQGIGYKNSRFAVYYRPPVNHARKIIRPIYCIAALTNWVVQLVYGFLSLSLVFQMVSPMMARVISLEQDFLDHSKAGGPNYLPSRMEYWQDLEFRGRGFGNDFETLTKVRGSDGILYFDFLRARICIYADSSLSCEVIVFV